MTLTLSVEGPGAGTVTSAPSGLTCGTGCAATFPAGANVTLTAAPAAGAIFTGWSGACAGAAPCTIVMDQPRAVIARFGLVFTDATLTPLSSIVRAAHVAELRSAIDTLRARQGLGAFAWTDPILVARATAIKRSHLVELRAALAAVYAAWALAAPGWTDPAIISGATLVRAAHIAELRAAVQALNP
jgi:hypothetical protein